MITIYSGSQDALGNRNKSAFAMAVAAGRLGYRSGLGPEREAATVSSPLTAFWE